MPIAAEPAPAPTPTNEEDFKAGPLDWVNLTTIAVCHLIAVGAILYMALVQFSWWTLGLGFLWFAFCGFAITGGYHRHFAHTTYKTNALVRFFHLLFGAAAVQNSALKWSSDHRRHHAFVDTPKDPYNIRQGFFWAHMRWVLHKADEKLSSVRDLEADPLVRFQHRFYIPLAIVAGIVLPAAIGSLWGDPLGAVLVAGFLRLVVQWHATFSVNSMAHTVGDQPYSTQVSARDSFWTALVTLGEGYHNFHHRFANDYRNGIRWFHIDPTKWAIWSLSKVGFAWDLKRTPALAIQRAQRG